MFLVLMLTGCGKQTEELDKAMNLRARLLNSQGCSFEAEVTADYGDKTYTFLMECQTDAQGNLTFTVREPEVISGITGKITGENASLTFDDAALSFELLADGQLSPVGAPWIFVNTLRGGYVTSCGQDGEYIRLTVDDSYEDDAFTLDIWLENEDTPIQAEILWEGHRILTIAVRNFTIL